MSANSVLILFIDGNDQEREYYSQRLKASTPDFVVIEAVTGQYGLALYKALPAIECVVLELDLPDMYGIEVLAMLVPVAHQPEIAVVVLTRLHNPTLLGFAVQSGAQAALQKSTTSGDILETTVLTAISKVRRDRKRAT